MIEKFGGRKFIFAMLAIILSFILVVLKMVEPTDWFNFTGVIGGSYIIGNVASKLTNGLKK